MYLNHMLMRILDEQKKTNKLLEESEQPFSISFDSPRLSEVKEPKIQLLVDGKRVTPVGFASATRVFEADRISTGTIKAVDLNEKLDKLSVLGTIDRYAVEQAEDRMKKAAQISDSAAQFKKFITIDRLWESATGEVERMLEIAVQNKIEEMITNKTDSDKSKNDALNELFEEYKLSEDD
ncbi:hypothetical protein [Enterococcus wangshanyuanii]|uniref:Uncharacterized protein n=1 Tax=Enterococcus wangshanyuanii TaxID=2005703 RepID=A0ABQ1P175_9ENTE|nr:hypothetical protein [Enterococcus wangshanyuanii]GGC88296.1 hypothetical protein GCM10011573_17380 [Enterococcus wangshanyuanii]